MLTMGLVNTRDHDLDVLLLLRNLPRGEAEEKGLIVCPRKRYNNRGGSTPHGTPGGPLVEQSFSLATYLISL